MFKVNVEGIQPYVVEELIEDINGKGGNVDLVDEKEMRVYIPHIGDKLNLIMKVKRLKSLAH